MNILDELDQYSFQYSLLNEDEKNQMVKHLKLEILDIERFVTVNSLLPVTNPVFFIKDTVPTSDGLLSNEIFGLSKYERSNIWAYLDLNSYYIDPSCYKVWVSLDKNIKACVHGTKFIIIDGKLVQSDKGECGVTFLKKNFNELIFRRTSSNKRDMKILYLKKNKDRMFIKKYPVIPPYYRDISSTGKNIGVGKINQLYASILMSLRSLTSQDDYGLSRFDSIHGKIQETLLTIYDWFCGNNNVSISSDETGTGLSGKFGILQKAGLDKTSDFSSRLVLSAPELKVQRSKDLMVNMHRSALPLAAALADFYPFILFHVRRFFENEFAGVKEYPVLTKTGEIINLKPKDPLINFSDDRIKSEIKKFIYSYSNRFVPIEVPMENFNGKVYMRFVGRKSTDLDIKSDITPDSITKRKLTWCDVFYMAAVEATKDKAILITRYPIDSKFNQIPTGIVVSSTKDTEPMLVNETFYPYYPYISEKDILSNTSDKFIDTLMISNLLLKGFKGDYDGDQTTVKAVYYEESNKELLEFIDSKLNYIDLGGTNIRITSIDIVQVLYNMTLILSDTKITEPIF